MSFELIVFASPESSHGFLMLDNGTNLIGHPAVHSSGRKGIGFTIPDNSPNSNGCAIRLEDTDRVSIEQRAILFLRTAEWETKYSWGPGQTAAIAVDDFHLQELPPPIYIPVPIPPEPPIPPNPADPFSIIEMVYATGKYTLLTKESCGKFTEECCKQLHDLNSPFWGHIRKFPGQNQYNGHAVDAIMLLKDNNETTAGIYDIILDSESPNAKPSFNYKGPADANLWYYPA